MVRLTVATVWTAVTANEADALVVVIAPDAALTT